MSSRSAISWNRDKSRPIFEAFDPSFAVATSGKPQWRLRKQYDFHEGETLHTEHSRKYTVAGFQAMAARAGFEPGTVWTDANGWFALLWLRSPSVP